MKVLIIGFACLPGTGGETSHTWNWARHLSRLHEVWVLTCPGDRPVAQPTLGESLDSHLRMHWLAVPHWLRERNSRGGSIGLVINYLRWLKMAYVKALELHEQIGFDIVHHVSLSSINAPPPFWKLPVPFVWGPIGGAQRVPRTFRKYVSSFSVAEILRSSRVALLPLSLSLRRIARSGTTVLTTNQETYGLLTKVSARDVHLFLDSGMPSSFLSAPRITGPTGRPFTILWAGRMEPRKALPLALEALRETNDLHVKLLIAGDGQMRNKWEAYAGRLNLGNKVKFFGHVPWNDMSRLYQSVDAFLFTSLRDSFGTQVLEAMGHGLPILTLDHQGVGSFVPSNAGIKVSVTHPRETVRELAEGIRRLALFPWERRKMGDAARAYAETETWERRAARMSEIYEQAVARWNTKKHEERMQWLWPPNPTS